MKKRLIIIYVGATRKTLCMKTARAYGFGNTGTTIASSLNEAIEILINTGKIEETDGKLNIKE